MTPIKLSVEIENHNTGVGPDYAAVGKAVDDVLKKHFMDKAVVVRCIGSQDHKNINLDELTDLVLSTGTDKYDDKRIGVGYKEFTSKGIQVDFYGTEVKVTLEMDFMPQQIWEMHPSAIGDRGHGVNVDLVLVYDRAQLNMVHNLYDGQTTSDGFTFKDGSNKSNALLAAIKISKPA